MTLLVSAKVGGDIWMLADTAITGGSIPLRERHFTKKIETPTRRSLVGFAGDMHIGHQTMRDVATAAEGQQVLQRLAAVTRSSHVEFAYAYDDSGDRRLFQVSDGTIRECPTLHLGNTEAFSRFQKARHDQEIDHAPEAIHKFMMASGAQELATATIAMLRVFAEREDHDVGGWPTPFLLDCMGAHPISYAYSVTDPITNGLKTGDPVPNGSAERGGFGLSYSGFAGTAGMVAYWLQYRGGRVYTASPDGYNEYVYAGSPSEFAEAVEAELGERPHVWFGGDEIGVAERVQLLLDQQGQPRIAIARKGRNIGFGWVQGPEQSFRVQGEVRMDGDEAADNAEGARFRIELSTDDTRATIVDLRTNIPMELEASEIDELVSQIAQMRGKLSPAAPSEPENMTLTAQIDPRWRTRPGPHPAVPGALLLLRHSGLGWVSFILPPHEQEALGRWLVENASKTPRRPNGEP